MVPAGSIDDTPPDIELVAAATRGDERAVRALVRRHGPRLVACAERIVGDRGLAEEIVQDVYLQVVRRGASFRGQSSVRTWLVAMTLNRARSLRRRWSFRFVGRSTHLDATLPDESPTSLERIDACERRTRLDQALATLSADAREIIALRFDSGLSYDEIARVLACAPGTVASRLSRALRRLGDVLRANGWPDEGGNANE